MLQLFVLTATKGKIICLCPRLITDSTLGEIFLSVYFLNLGVKL